MRILGIDQSIAESGVCVINWDKFGSDANIEYSATIETSSKLDQVHRLALLRKAVTTLLSYSQLKPDYVVREQVNFGATGSANNLFDLGGVAAVVDLACLDCNYSMSFNDFYVLNITTPKIATFGNGNFAKGKSKKTKQLYMGRGNAKYGTDFTNDNELDAYMLAYTLGTYLFLKKDPRIVWSKLDSNARRALIDDKKLKRRGLSLGSVTSENCVELLKDLISR
jgi:Holliday junction resolvasome RuvABC endonuclease subunit